MGYSEEVVNTIEASDIDLLRAYEHLKKNPPKKMHEVLRVSNELIHRGWRKTEDEEWEWRIPGF